MTKPQEPLNKRILEVLTFPEPDQMVSDVCRNKFAGRRKVITKDFSNTGGLASTTGTRTHRDGVIAYRGLPPFCDVLEVHSESPRSQTQRSSPITRNRS